MLHNKQIPSTIIKPPLPTQIRADRGGFSAVPPCIILLAETAIINAETRLCLLFTHSTQKLLGDVERSLSLILSLHQLSVERSTVLLPIIAVIFLLYHVIYLLSTRNVVNMYTLLQYYGFLSTHFCNFFHIFLKSECKTILSQETRPISVRFQ